jgi:hypothetical protein
MTNEGGDRAPAGGDEPVLKLRQDDLAARGFDEETIVLDLRGSNYLSTNPAGTVLWRELEKGATRERLIQALLDEFEITEKRAAADVDAFIDDCRRRGLLSEETALPGPK